MRTLVSEIAGVGLGIESNLAGLGVGIWAFGFLRTAPSSRPEVRGPLIHIAIFKFLFVDGYLFCLS